MKLGRMVALAGIAVSPGLAHNNDAEKNLRQNLQLLKSQPTEAFLCCTS